MGIGSRQEIVSKRLSRVTLHYWAIDTEQEYPLDKFPAWNRRPSPTSDYSRHISAKQKGELSTILLQCIRLGTRSYQRLLKHQGFGHVLVMPSIAKRNVLLI